MVNLFVIGMWMIVFSQNSYAEKITSISIEQALQKVLGNEPKIKSAQSRLSATQNSSYSQISNFFPKAYFDVQLATYKDRVKTEYESFTPVVARERNYYLGELVLEQNLFSGFSDYFSYRESSLERENKFFELQQQKLDAMLSVTESYFSIQYLRIQLEAAKNHFSNLEAQMRESKNKWELGRATELDYLTSLYEYEKLNPQILEIRQNLQIEILRFGERLGESLNSELVLLDEIVPAYSKLAAKTLPIGDVVEKYFLERNFRYLAMRKDLEASDYKIGKVSATHAPSVSAQYRIQQSADRRNEVLDPKNRDQLVMLQVHVPIFSALSSVSQRKEAVELKSAKEEELKSWLQDARIEWTQILYKLEYLKVLVESEKLNESVAKKRVISLKNQYQQGKVTVKDYLDSLTLQLQVKTSLAQAQKNFIVTYFKLKGMLGEFPINPGA